MHNQKLKIPGFHEEICKALSSVNIYYMKRICIHEVFVNIMRDCEQFNNNADILGWHVAATYIVACKSHSSKELKRVYD